MSDAGLQALAKRYADAGDLASAQAYHRALVRSGKALADSRFEGDPLLAFLDGAERDDEAACDALEQLGERAEEVLVPWLGGLERGQLLWLFLIAVLHDPRIGDGERMRLWRVSCDALGVDAAPRPGVGLVRVEDHVDRFLPRNSIYIEGGPAEIRLRVLTLLSPEAERALLGSKLLELARPVLLAAVLTVLRDPATATTSDYPEFEITGPEHRLRDNDDPERKVRGQKGLRDTHVLGCVLAYLTRHPSLLAEDEICAALADLLTRESVDLNAAYHALDKLMVHLPVLPERLALALLTQAASARYAGKRRATVEIVGLLPKLDGTVRERAEALVWKLMKEGSGADEIVPAIRRGLERDGIDDPFLREHYVEVLEAYARANLPVPTGRVAQLFSGNHNPYPELEEVYAAVSACTWGFVQDVLNGVDWDYASADWA